MLIQCPRVLLVAAMLSLIAASCRSRDHGASALDGKAPLSQDLKVEQYPSIVTVTFAGMELAAEKNAEMSNEVDATCTGAVVATNAVLTGGHCFDSFRDVSLDHIGVLLRGKPVPPPALRYIHPLYQKDNDDRMPFDVAILIWDHDVFESIAIIKFEHAEADYLTIYGSYIDGKERVYNKRVTYLEDGTIQITREQLWDRTLGNGMITHGYSGGPALDADGRVVGISSAIEQIPRQNYDSKGRLTTSYVSGRLVDLRHYWLRKFLSEAVIRGAKLPSTCCACNAKLRKSKYFMDGDLGSRVVYVLRGGLERSSSYCGELTDQWAWLGLHDAARPSGEGSYYYQYSACRQGEVRECLDHQSTVGPNEDFAELIDAQYPDVPPAD